MANSRIKLKVGIFILLLLINIVGVVSYIFIKKGTFEKRYNYYLITYSAQSLTVGMPVKVSGFTVGRVDAIELKDNGAVKLTFSVDEENKKWVAKESLLMIRKPLIGSTYIILYSAIGNETLKEGTTLEHIVSNDINDLVLKLEPIVIKMGKIVNSIDKITTYISKDDSELMKIIKNIEQFSSTLAENKSLLTSLTGDEKSTDSFIKSINKMYSLINNFNKVGSNLNKTSDNINKDVLPLLKEFMKELNIIAKDIETKLKSLDSVIDKVSSSDKDIVTIKKQIKTGISKTNKIIEKVDNLFLDERNKKVVLP
jgi:ABC-type transporter Mla subunit MlaD